jgi:hypothetical protein
MTHCGMDIETLPSESTGTGPGRARRTRAFPGGSGSRAARAPDRELLREALALERIHDLGGACGGEERIALFNAEISAVEHLLSEGSSQARSAAGRRLVALARRVHVVEGAMRSRCLARMLRQIHAVPAILAEQWLQALIAGQVERGDAAECAEVLQLCRTFRATAAATFPRSIVSAASMQT